MADQNRNNQSVTWNSGGTAFDGYKLNVTDTASAAASLLLNFQVGGAARFTVRKDGLLTSAAGYVLTANDGGALGTSAIGFSDLFLASGGVIDFATSDVTITHSSNLLAFAGASSGYTFDAAGTFTGVVTAANGTAAAPGFKFASAQTGIYRTATDGGVGFAIAGAAKGSFHATGFSVPVIDALVSNAGAVVGCSLSYVGAISSYMTTGINLSLGQNNDFTAVSLKRNGVSVGTITCTGAVTAYNTSSDKTLKTALRPFDSGRILDDLDVGEFNWLADGKVGYGVLAQDAYEVFPPAVTPGHVEVDDAGEESDIPWSADYSKYVPLLIAEIKALRRRLAAAGL